MSAVQLGTSRDIPWMIAKFRLTWICQNCKGKGNIGMRSWCDKCGKVDPGINQATGDLLCGHSFVEYFREEDNVCPECEGEGVCSENVSIHELVDALKEFLK